MDRSLLADLEAFPEGLPAAAVESNMLQLVLAVQFMHDNQVRHSCILFVIMPLKTLCKPHI